MSLCTVLTCWHLSALNNFILTLMQDDCCRANTAICLSTHLIVCWNTNSFTTCEIICISVQYTTGPALSWFLYKCHAQSRYPFSKTGLHSIRACLVAGDWSPVFFKDWSTKHLLTVVEYVFFKGEVYVSFNSNQDLPLPTLNHLNSQPTVTFLFSGQTAAFMTWVTLEMTDIISTQGISFSVTICFKWASN